MRVLASTALPMQPTRHPPKLPLSISVSREIERRSFTSTALREATSNAHDNGDGTCTPSASTPVGGRAPIGGRCAPSLELGPIQSPLMMLEHIPATSPAPCSPWRRSDQPRSQGAGRASLPPQLDCGPRSDFVCSNPLHVPLQCYCHATCMCA